MGLMQISIRHGDLAYARHPVLAGHYRGDVIIHAEQELDRRIGMALSHRSSLGLYPGRRGTQAVFFNDDKWAKPSGAIVVGLGQVGGLTPVLLQSGVRDALLEFALQVMKWPDDRFNIASGRRSAAVSCLLVGSGAGGVSVADSVGSILRAAVQANELLETVQSEEQLEKKIQKVSIDHIEFIDVYRDRVLTAADELERLLEDKKPAEEDKQPAEEAEKLAKKVKWEPRVIDEGEGRLYRLRSTEPEGWWHPLEIIQERIDKKWLGLRFIASTDGARAEMTQAVGQLRLAENFISDATDTWVSNTDVGKTLYELLLPNRLKEIAQRQGNLVLLVDEVSARYPWEALEDRWDANKCPVAIAAGMIRQLKTAQFRLRPAYALSKTALVVGNPNLKWPLFKDLPGAKKEAEVVARMLGGGEYDVTACIGKQAKDIIEGLHQKPWRILHLAGHGEHEYPIEKDTVYPAGGEPAAEPESDEDRKISQKMLVSGMAIGKEVFLTPGDVEQMRWTPELVFINCCYLADTSSPTPMRYNELAANLGVQFINMGVKAVIAAGWAVHDDASHVFAEIFYTRMLAGEMFGEAVRFAREQIKQQFPGANTWAAYQCYGDPGFRLLGEGGVLPPVNPAKYHSPCELIADLENLSEQIRVQSAAPSESKNSLDKWEKEISDCIDRIPDAKGEEWRKRADVAAAIGFAWGELQQWDKAIPALKTAIAGEKSNCALRVIEQCANFEVRLAAKQWPQAPEEQRIEHVKTIDSAIRKLRILARCAETAERLNLIAASYKRLALVQTGSASAKALRDAATYYAKALDKNRDSAYAFTNWATTLMLGDSEAARSEGTKLDEDAARLKNALTQDDFWNSAGIADLDLVRLIAAVLAEDPLLNAKAAGLKQDVIDGYGRAFKRGASPRQKDSVLENLKFVIGIIENREDPLRKAVEEIRQFLSPAGEGPATS
jgi:CHAT domain-containing protein